MGRRGRGRAEPGPDGEDDGEDLPVWSGPEVFERRADGRFDVNLAGPVRELVVAGADGLRDHILAGAGQPGPLFPVAHPDRPDLEHDYQQLMGGDLVESRLAAIDVLEATAAADVVDEGQLVGWMQTVNAMRLVLAEDLGITEDMDEVDIDDERAPRFAYYELLGNLVAHMVRALQRDGGGG